MSTLVENVQKVKNAHAALKTAIASKGVDVPESTKLTDMPALVEQIETGGSVEPTNDRAVFAYDTATSLVIPNTLIVDMASATNLRYCFYNCSNLTSLSLPDGFGQAATNIEGCFYNCATITSLILPAGLGKVATNASRCFQGCAALQTLSLPDGFGQAAATLYNCFANSRALTTLHLPTGFGQNATDLNHCFRNCAALTNITGNPNFKTSLALGLPNLTHDSLMVVINGLQTVISTQTLTLGSTNLAKLTDEEKQIATDKGWTLA